MSTILIVGAKSDMAKAAAFKYAENGYDLVLAARNSASLRDFAADLSIRTSQKAVCCDLDILDYDSHQSFYDGVVSEIGAPPAGVITAVGYMGDQIEARNNFSESHQTIDVNFTGLVSLLNIIANDFENKKAGFIIGISSVAGDRGRKKNYIYGAAKAGFTAYLSGLRNRLYESGVHVLTVKPGFVYTKMTEGLDLPEKLTAHPKDVATDIFQAQKKKKNVLYTKGLWRIIMMIVKSIPEWQFKKMDI